MSIHSEIHSCPSAMLNADEIQLGEPLARLKEEHGPLREQMGAYAEFGVKIGTSGEVKDWMPELTELRRMVVAFVERLEPHSELEEGVLFTLMAKYIGRESGPIAVMEYEHDQAKANLAKFLSLTEVQTGPLTSAQAAELATYAITAYAILTEHFLKEENVLFPMAETMLTQAEKNFLNDQMNHKGAQ